MSSMKDSIRLPAELGQALREARLSAKLSVSELAKQAGKVRDVIYRLEAGEDTTVASLLAVLSVLKLRIRLEGADMPTLAEVQARFGSLEDEE